jgi:REP element-mobilizing transposase RayT
MPRKARLDAPGALHHIIVRGINRRKIFFDDADRDDFLDRLSGILSDSKSILCQEDPYLLELVRYIHLNPLRAGIVKDLRGLNKYP